jgi:hypothetical protein
MCEKKPDQKNAVSHPKAAQAPPHEHAKPLAKFSTLNLCPANDKSALDVFVQWATLVCVKKNS